MEEEIILDENVNDEVVFFESDEVVPEDVKEASQENIEDNNTFDLSQFIYEHDSDIPSYSELLLDYIQNNQVENVTLEGELEGDVVEEGEVETIDYSSFLSTLETLLQDNTDTISDIFTEYEDNNNLQADVNDISLTNMLLLTCLIIIMFTAVLNFTRRIF